MKIGSTDLNGWKATGDHFPKLEHLSLFSCKKLKEIPSGFAEISKLKSIDLADCRPSVVASAEKIKEEQLDYLNNIVDVVVSERRGYSQISEPESDETELCQNSRRKKMLEVQCLSWCKNLDFCSSVKCHSVFVEYLRC
nr:disease resistance protein RPP13-like isoform X6 [Ipomoea batatas]